MSVVPVRDAEKAVWTSKYFKDRYGVGHYTTTIIQDMAKQYSFDIAVRGCSGVIHVASVHLRRPQFRTTSSLRLLQVVVNALEAAAKTPDVRRFVYCSSVAAAVSHDRGVRNEITSDSWNMLDFEDAWAPPPYQADRLRAVHASSKMQAEAAVWRWYGRRKPAFVLNTGKSCKPRIQRSIADSQCQCFPDTLLGQDTRLEASRLPAVSGDLERIIRWQRICDSAV